MNNYVYVNELPDIIIHEIIEIYKNHELGFTSEDIQNALDSKVYDISEIIDIEDMLIHRHLEMLKLYDIDISQEFEIFTRKELKYELNNGGAYSDEIIDFLKDYPNKRYARYTDFGIMYLDYDYLIKKTKERRA